MGTRSASENCQAVCPEGVQRFLGEEEQMAYFYLDSPGIWALFEQTINEVENEFDRLYQTDPTGSLDEKTVSGQTLE